MSHVDDGTTPGTALEWNMLVPLDDPYPVYRRLRDEAPVYYDRVSKVWALTRFDDVRAAAEDWETFSTSASGTGNDLDDTYQLFLPAGDVAGNDPPIHTRLRAALRGAFSPSALRVRFEPAVRDHVARRLEAVAGTGHVDLAADLARPIPGSVMFSWFGFPEADHPQLLAWFGDMLERYAGRPELPARAIAARDQVRAFVLETARERRAHPTDDLMTFLVAGVDSGELAEDELLGASLLLFVAGITTTSGLISNSLFHLAEFPEQRARLVADPGLLPGAIEELVRFDAPIQALIRATTRDVTLHGTTISAGERVALVWASANHDERHLPDADKLDVGRPPQRHLSFGEGIHHCIGAPLARLEAKIVLDEVLKRMPNYEIDGPIVRIKTPTDRALEQLPVRF
jgi:cytochrome P450